MNPHQRVITFVPGDFVFVHTKNLPIKVPGSRKLKPLWVGPFRVIRAIGTNAYELDLPATLEQITPCIQRIHPQTVRGTSFVPS